MPLLDELPEALGWMYVIELATQSGEALTYRLSPLWRPSSSIHLAYLRCYGDETAARWCRLGTALDAYAVASADVGARDRIALAATDCLIRLPRWLSASSPVAIQAAASTRSAQTLRTAAEAARRYHTRMLASRRQATLEGSALRARDRRGGRPV